MTSDLVYGAREMTSDLVYGAREMTSDLVYGAREVTSDLVYGAREVTSDLVYGAREMTSDLVYGAREVTSDLVYGRPRQDIMELVEEDNLPQLFYLPSEIVSLPSSPLPLHMGESGQQLQLTQQNLSASVLLLQLCQ